jgi:hypothetical protein
MGTHGASFFVRDEKILVMPKCRHPYIQTITIKLALARDAEEVT